MIANKTSAIKKDKKRQDKKGYGIKRNKSSEYK